VSHWDRQQLVRKQAYPLYLGKAALAGRNCVGRTGIKIISTVEYLNPKLLTTLSGIISRDNFCRSSSHPCPPEGRTEAHRLGNCTLQLQRPRLADRSLPTLANVFPLFRQFKPKWIRCQALSFECVDHILQTQDGNAGQTLAGAHADANDTCGIRPHVQRPLRFSKPRP
jgi:hypothetical protein